MQPGFVQKATMVDPLHVERLQGARVLLAENQTVIALDLEFMLRRLGCIVCGITGSIGETLPRIEQDHPDVVILNPRLDDGVSLPIVEILRQRQIPFILVKGHRENQPAHPVWEQAFHLDWPYGSDRLGHVLVLALDQATPALAPPRLQEA